MSSQENDETEERETGSTMSADSVRRLGSLSGNWHMSGKELMPTNTLSFAWIKTLPWRCQEGWAGFINSRSKHWSLAGAYEASNSEN